MSSLQLYPIQLVEINKDLPMAPKLTARALDSSRPDGARLLGFKWWLTSASSRPYDLPTFNFPYEAAILT